MDRHLTVRAFLAVDVAPEIRAALIELKRTLADSRAAVRWVRDENLHATVRFLGAVAETQLPALHAALRNPVSAQSPPRAQVRELGTFPTLKRPRVVWVGLQCPPLALLAAAVGRALAPLGFRVETRPFTAHITLGRVNGLQGWAALEALLRANASRDLGACTIHELVGFRSDLRRDGAVYTKLWSIPFGG